MKPEAAGPSKWSRSAGHHPTGSSRIVFGIRIVRADEGPGGVLAVVAGGDHFARLAPLKGERLCLRAVEVESPQPRRPHQSLYGHALDGVAARVDKAKNSCRGAGIVTVRSSVLALAAG